MNMRHTVRSMFMYCSACAVYGIAAFAPAVADAALRYEPSNYAARDALLLQLDGIRNVGLLKAHDNNADTWFNLVDPRTSAMLSQYKTNTGNSFTYTEDMGMVRIVWSMRQGGLTLLLR